MGLVLNIIGTLGVGLIPYFGMAAGFGGPIVFKGPLWAVAWALAWVIWIVGVVLLARAPARLG